MATLKVKVVPGSSRDCIAGWLGDALKIKVVAAPEKGKANAAVVRLLASLLDIDRDAVRITAGHSSPNKTITIDGFTRAGLEAALKDRIAGA